MLTTANITTMTNTVSIKKICHIFRTHFLFSSFFLDFSPFSHLSRRSHTYDAIIKHSYHKRKRTLTPTAHGATFIVSVSQICTDRHPERSAISRCEPRRNSLQTDLQRCQSRVFIVVTVIAVGQSTSGSQRSRDFWFIPGNFSFFHFSMLHRYFLLCEVRWRNVNDFFAKSSSHIGTLKPWNFPYFYPFSRFSIFSFSFPLFASYVLREIICLNEIMNFPEIWRRPWKFTRP